jgi:ATP-dependent Lon protease
MKSRKNIFPLIPFKDILVFPNTNSTFKAGREITKSAIDAAMKKEPREIAVVLQKNSVDEQPGTNDIHSVGTICSIIQVVDSSDGVYHVFLEGKKRVLIKSAFYNEKGYLEAETAQFNTINKRSSDIPKLRKIVESSLKEFFFGRRMTADFLTNILNIQDDEKFLDLITAGFFEMEPEEAQKILETADLKERFSKTASFIKLQLELRDLEDSIESTVKESFEKYQKEYFINEQINALRGELAGSATEENEIQLRIEQLDAPQNVKDHLEKEFKRYSSIPPMSSESSVIRSYIETLLSLPWNKCSSSGINIKTASKTLETDHFGLEEVKERILEYLAVLKLKGDLKAPILCLAGPPGVGKTSIASSVAQATGRKFVRVALGGIKDEAEIRGHRRTYVGAMPGKIIRNINITGTKDPLFLLDEIDKLGNDYKGDPASALLEVLDPEQNSTFVDHYVDLEFDLSKVLFIATANDKNSIPPALRDRMEIIDIDGYTEYEKKNIALKYLLPKQISANGLESKDLSFTKDGLRLLIDRYTSEAGVRELERKIASICRKIALKKVSQKESLEKLSISKTNITSYLGPEKYSEENRTNETAIGVVNGLAWTPYGGSVLQMEAIRYPGKGDIKTTGSIGDIMKESVDIAVSFIKSIADGIPGIDKDDWNKNTLHVHFPEGAVPKDGPSAGIAISVAIASVMSGRAVKSNIGMTGELTLRGKILKIGGLHAKLMAAEKSGIKRVYLPEGNRQDLEKIPQEITKGLEIILSSNAEKVINESLVPFNKKLKNNK